MPLRVVRRESEHLYAREPASPAARAAVDALLRLRRIEEQQIERARVHAGLTDNEFHAVRFLLQADRDDRPMGPKDLGVMLGVSNASVTNIVDSLVGSGDLERTPHPTDRRAQVLKPTAAAAAKIDAAYARFHEAVVTAVDDLSARDHAVLARCLGAVSDAFLADEPEDEDEDEDEGDEGGDDDARDGDTSVPSTP